MKSEMKKVAEELAVLKREYAAKEQEFKAVLAQEIRKLGFGICEEDIRVGDTNVLGFDLGARYLSVSQDGPVSSEE